MTFGVDAEQAGPTFNVEVAAPTPSGVTVAGQGPQGPKGDPGPPGPPGVATVPLTGSQPAEGTALPVFVIQPATAGEAPFELVLSSALFNGTWDQVAFLGWNPEAMTPGGAGAVGQQSWHLGFENQYNNGTDIATEFYLQYRSSDGSQSFRPLMIDVLMTSPNQQAGWGFIDLGTGANKSAAWDWSFTFQAGAGNPIMRLQPTATVGSNQVQIHNQLSLLGSTTLPANMGLYTWGTNVPATFQYLDKGVAKWTFYWYSGDPVMRLQDAANGRWHLILTPGATPAAAVTELNSSAKIDGNVGFYGQTPAVKQTVTGAKGANAALASLLTALANIGLVTDSTTA